jgi:hypothetical protein
MMSARSKDAPESARVQPSSVLDIPCDLTLEKMQALERGLVDWHKARQ